MNDIDARFRGRLGSLELEAEFRIPARGITALFGPSGCGKTTVLRCLAGLTRLDGHLSVAGETWQSETVFLPPHLRRVGYVFQEPSLFPHLTVRGNLAFGQRRSRTPPSEIGMGEVARLLGFERLLDRSPAQLSGGERQRVAIGRALLSGSRLLLMDEPLAALDRASKDEIVPYLETLHNSLAIPVIYVSHDIAEVERLADRIVLMQDGRVARCEPLAEFTRRNSPPLIAETEAGTVLAGRVAGSPDEDGLTPVDVDGGRFWVPGVKKEAPSPLRIHIPASGVTLFVEPPGRGSVLNVLPARIVSIDERGSTLVTVGLRIGEAGEGATFQATVTRRSRRELGLVPGLAVRAAVKAVAVADRGGAIL